MAKEPTEKGHASRVLASARWARHGYRTRMRAVHRHQYVIVDHDLKRPARLAGVPGLASWRTGAPARYPRKVEDWNDQ